MAILLTLVILAPPTAAEKTPLVVAALRAGETTKALALLKDIGTLKENHAEAAALVKMIRSNRVKKPPEVMEASFLALQGIGSRKVTRKVIALLKVKPLKKARAVRVGICRALSGSADPTAVETIVKLLRDPDDHVIAAAAEAAGAYRYAKDSVRKELFKTIMGIYVGTWNMKNTVNPQLKKEKRRAEQKWEIVEQAMEKAMQLLSNVTQNDPPAWRKWWNKNKKKRWAALEE
ncbi:MAG: HEAT repeat domain-containing protein [Planctomycetota bacterium]|nr:HEAT repeat domain-containing protein [Planctomycetota bacterium]